MTFWNQRKHFIRKDESEYFQIYETNFSYDGLKYKKIILLRCIHHFKSDLIYNMDHLRISDT